jgi:hypothetical protein
MHASLQMLQFRNGSLAAMNRLFQEASAWGQAHHARVARYRAVSGARIDRPILVVQIYLTKKQPLIGLVWSQARMKRLDLRSCNY